jgi:D-3-phosphoglycerate dehydrogenase / 2-oxoglutarate reductase
MTGAGKAARTDAGLECLQLDAGLRARGLGLVLLPDGVSEAALRALQQGRLGGAALDVYTQEPLARRGDPLSEPFELDHVLLTPHLTFYTSEAMQRLEQETLQRCDELLAGGAVPVKSRDPRLTSQRHGVRFD